MPNKKYSVVFFGTSSFASHHLQFLIDNDHYEVKGVVSQPPRAAGRNLKSKKLSAVHELAQQKNLPIITPDKVGEESFWKTLKSWSVDCAIVVAYGQILPQEFLDLYPQKVFNVHASLLPRWRGAAPIQRAIMEGDEFTGVALQVMKKELDAGDVVGVREIKIGDDVNALQLQDQLQSLGVEILGRELLQYLEDDLKPIPQDPSLVTYASKIDKAESKIDWSKTAQDIYNQYRGLQMGAGIYCLKDQKRLKLTSLELMASSPDASVKPGTLVEVTNDFFIVACGEGALKVLEVQPESRSKMPAEDYIKGYSSKQGERLE